MVWLEVWLACYNRAGLVGLVMVHDEQFILAWLHLTGQFWLDWQWFMMNNSP